MGFITEETSWLSQDYQWDIQWHHHTSYNYHVGLVYDLHKAESSCNNLQMEACCVALRMQEEQEVSAIHAKVGYAFNPLFCVPCVMLGLSTDITYFIEDLNQSKLQICT
jgi:hypothetical protein